MKKFFVVAIAFFCAAFYSMSLTAEEIVIVGTGSGASVLKAIGNAFMAKNPGITVTVPKSIGSGGGIKAVGNDDNKIGRVARKIKDREAGLGLTYKEFALMPIVVFVNQNVSVDNLSEQQVCEIYNGNITDWADVGGKKGKIRVIRREDGDSSLEVLQDTIACFKKLQITKKSKTTFSDPDTVEKTGKTKNAIAFGTWPNVMNMKPVKALKIGGVHPTNSSYSHVGRLALIYKEKNNSGSIKKFIDFATSSAAHETIAKAGALAVK